MAAARVDSLIMPLEFQQSEEGSFMAAVFGTRRNRDSSTADLPRAASYNDFSRMQDIHSNNTSNDEARDSSSIEEASTKTPSTDNVSSSSSGNTTPDSEAAHTVKAGKSQADALRKGLPRLATSEKDINRAANAGEALTTPIKKTPVSKGEDSSDLLTPTTNRLTARLRRRSWMPSSRSPSPAKKKTAAEGLGDAFGKASSAVRRSSPFRRGLEPEEQGKARSRSSSLSRTISNKLQRRPTSAALDDLTKVQYPAPVAKSQLSKSFSTDRLSLSSFAKSKDAPPTPRLTMKEKQRLANPEPAKKRDELWNAFRSLDAEHQKFQTKPTSLKANVVRASLLPFLREYHNHPSTHNLRFEDLERRANILNKWWAGLLELISSKNNQSVSGTDRPSMFDGILGIMERPEWRLSPSPFCPLSTRKSVYGHKSTPSITSASSESSDLLGESVIHNIKNLFSQNLVEQMGYVVEKMAVRNAPASSVSFCGRTCAYAFFFCPGIADVLVRLWNPTMDCLNRVLQECGHKRSVNLKDTAQQIGQGFPSHLSAIIFNNISATYRSLRKPAPLPLRTHALPWSNPLWVNRWCGKDSDLFYVFVKHFHLLAVDFLPAETTRTERLCAPGVIFVHAQILVNMDATIHRNTTPSNPDPQNASSSTFEDILSDPDSTAPALYLPPTTNATRQMAENRLVMLVRDLLSERNTNPGPVRHIFAVAFADLLRAAARRTSIYGPNACYVLCDLLEEAFLILVRYEQLNPSIGSILDWSFWMDVWKRIVDSHNTTTEIRLYALLYSLWPALVIEPQRKVELCSSFLLEPDFFQSRFNHWCPMVRAYFMRLLCWRVARFDGEEQAGDVEVLQMLHECLQLQYSHYLHQREVASNSPLLMPSTAPCNPAPGRRLLIVRTDPIANPSRGAFMSFDGVLTPHPNAKRGSIMADIAAPEARPISNSSTDSEPDIEEKGVKKWGLLRTIIGTSKQEAKTLTPTRTPAVEKKEAIQRSVPSQPQTAEAMHEEKQQQNYRPFTFKFSLEWADRLDRRLQTPGPMRITSPKLPSPAQTLLLSRRRSHSAPSPPDTMETIFTDARSTKSDSNKSVEIQAIEPKGCAKASVKYTGRALAEWMLVVMECGSFFDRRRSEGVPSNRWVETPNLGVESFKRPG